MAREGKVYERPTFKRGDSVEWDGIDGRVHTGKMWSADRGGLVVERENGSSTVPWGWKPRKA